MMFNSASRMMFAALLEWPAASESARKAPNYSRSSSFESFEFCIEPIAKR